MVLMELYLILHPTLYQDKKTDLNLLIKFIFNLFYGGVNLVSIQNIAKYFQFSFTIWGVFHYLSPQY